jgi:hypothetical protein
VRLRSDYSAFRYKNLVNSSALRNNKGETATSEFFFKTAFDGKINVENTFVHRLLRSTSTEGPSFGNQALNDNFQIIFKPSKQLFILLTNEYFLPNMQKASEAYFFLDASVHLTTKKKLYEWRLSARNLTDNRVFKQVDVSDFSSTSFQTNLLPGHFLISVSRNF